MRSDLGASLGAISNRVVPLVDDSAEGSALPQLIAEGLAEAIIEGRLPSGTRLSEPAIAKAFGISRTPVREALFILQRDVLLVRQPRRSARVAEVTAKQAFEVYVCRAYLYGLSARMFAHLVDPDDLEQLSNYIEEMRAAVSREDQRAFYQLNLAFHDFIGARTRNDMLLKLIGGMGRLTLRFRFMSVTIPGRLQTSLELHEALLDDLRRRDAVQAEARVKMIISGAGDAVLAHFFGDHSNPVSHAVLSS